MLNLGRGLRGLRSGASGRRVAEALGGGGRRALTTVETDHPEDEVLRGGHRSPRHVAHGSIEGAKEKQFPPVVDVDVATVGGIIRSLDFRENKPGRKEAKDEQEHDVPEDGSQRDREVDQVDSQEIVHVVGLGLIGEDWPEDLHVVGAEVPVETINIWLDLPNGLRGHLVRSGTRHENDHACPGVAHELSGADVLGGTGTVSQGCGVRTHKVSPLCFNDGLDWSEHGTIHIFNNKK